MEDSRVRELIETAHGARGLIDLRVKHPDGHVEQFFFPALPAMQQPPGTHVWWGPAPRVGEDGTRASCRAPMCFFADLDPTGPELERVCPPISPPPSCVVWSGRGLQLYWFLQGPHLSNDEWERRSRAWVREVRRQLSSLTSLIVDDVHDLPRMMRLPGTVNPKSGKLAEIIDWRPDLVYDADVLLGRGGGELEAAPPRPTPFPEGQRNPGLWRLLSALKWGGLSEEPLRVSAHHLNQTTCAPPLPKAEVDGMVDRLSSPNSPQPITISQTELLRQTSDVAALAAERLADSLFSVTSGGRAQWYEWSGEAGVWVEGSGVAQLSDWLRYLRSSLEEEDTAGHRLVARCLDVGQVPKILSYMAANSELPTFLPPASINRLDTVLPLRNGYLDLASVSLIPPAPIMYFTSRAEVDYDELARCPRWEKFMAQMIPDEEERRFLGACFYYCLTGLNTARCFFVNIGNGRNGKTLAWEVLSALLGSFSGPGDTRTVACGGESTHDTHLLTLRHRRLAIYDELNDGDQLNGAQIKRITGAEELLARGAHSTKHERVRMTCKNVLITNHRPTIDGNDKALGDRLRYIQWRVRLREDEVRLSLKNELLEERSGILNWVLSHRPLFESNPMLLMPKSLDQETRAYMEDENPILSFVREFVEIPPGGFDPAKRIDGAYLRDKWTLYSGGRNAGRGAAEFYRKFMDAVAMEGGKLERLKNARPAFLGCSLREG